MSKHQHSEASWGVDDAMSFVFLYVLYKIIRNAEGWRCVITIPILTKSKKVNMYRSQEYSRKKVFQKKEKLARNITLCRYLDTYVL